MGTTCIVAYKPFADQEEMLQALLSEHVPILQNLGLVTPQPVQMLRAGDGTIIEVFEWASEAAREHARDDLAVQNIQGRLERVCECRQLGSLREAQELFGAFEPLT